MGLTGLPHPDFVHSHVMWLMSYTSWGLSYGHGVPMAEVDLAWHITLVWFAGFVLSLVAMLMYQTNVKDNKPLIPWDSNVMMSGNFRHGLFECFSNHNECLYSFCCPALRFADTHSSVTLTGFWASFVLFICINGGIGFASDTIANIVVSNQEDPAAVQSNQQVSAIMSVVWRGWIFGLWSRKILRTKLGDPDPSKNQGWDCLAWGCCLPCALTQESVEVDIAADVAISCPWNLKIGRYVLARQVAQIDYERMVGDAVLLEGR